MLRTEQHAARNLDRNELDHIIAVNEPQVFSEGRED
jgi:hypothetical protein